MKILTSMLPSAPARDLRPLILCGPAMLEKNAILRKLYNLLPNHFTNADCYCTEPNTPHHISHAQFKDIVQRDQFALHIMLREVCHGVTRQALAAAAVAQKIVVMEFDKPGVEQLKALPNFAARYVFIAPPSREVTRAHWNPGQIEIGEIQIHEPTRQTLAGLRLDVGYNPYVDSIVIEYSRIRGV